MVGFAPRRVTRSTAARACLLVSCAIIVVGCGTFSRASATETPAVATAAPASPATAIPPTTTTTAVTTRPPTSSPVPSSSPAPVPLAIGNTGGDGVFIRATPGSGDRIKAWPDGTVMSVIGPDQVIAGQGWKNVKDPDGNVGWVSGQYLGVAATTGVAAPLGAGSATTATPATRIEPTVLVTAAPPSKVTPIPLSVSFVSVVGGHPGENANVTAQTAVAANCTISFVAPHGTEVSAAGLAPNLADSSGRVAWSWRIDPNTPMGSGVVTVTCNGASATTEMSIN